MIEVKNLTKIYGQHVAVDNISFKVQEGEILGFLGPNGAGKTTTMNMMTGYISSTEGTVIINGFDILENPEKAKKEIGYLPDMPPVYGDMTVMEYLYFVCDIKGVKKTNRKNMLDEIINTVKINDVKNRIIKNLSKGYRQRVGLAQALVGFPKVLILDEPTVGLDPKQIIEMREVIKNLGKRHTVILSSHILSEVSAVCDRIMIINNGKIVASDTTEGLSNNFTSGRNVALKVKGEKEAAKKAFLENPLFKDVIFNEESEDGVFDISVQSDGETDIREEVFNTAVNNGLVLLMMKPLDLTLEDIFLKVTQGEELEQKKALNEDIDIKNIEIKLSDDDETYIIDNKEISEESDETKGGDI